MAVPITDLPSRNCTEPVAPAGAMLAVNVTACPPLAWEAGFAARVVVEFALFTVCTSATDVLPV